MHVRTEWCLLGQFFFLKKKKKFFVFVCAAMKRKIEQKQKKKKRRRYDSGDMTKGILEYKFEFFIFLHTFSNVSVKQIIRHGKNAAHALKTIEEKKS